MLTIIGQIHTIGQGLRKCGQRITDCLYNYFYYYRIVNDQYRFKAVDLPRAN